MSDEDNQEHIAAVWKAIKNPDFSFDMFFLFNLTLDAALLRQTVQ